MTADEWREASTHGCHNIGSVVATRIRIKCNSPGFCEVAVVDTAGRILLNTLVNPCQPIQSTRFQVRTLVRRHSDPRMLDQVRVEDGRHPSCEAVRTAPTSLGWSGSAAAQAVEPQNSESTAFLVSGGQRSIEAMLASL